MRRVVVFDVGGVLIRWDDRWVLREVARRTGADAPTLDRLLPVLRPRLQSGAVDVDGFFDELARRSGQEIPPSVRSLWWRMLERQATPRREVIAWAAELRRRGLDTVLFSNTDPSHRRYFQRPWSRGLRPALLSYELGAVKPSPQAFRRARARLALPTDRICLMDDVEANVRAARRQGWHAHRFETVPKARSYLERIGWIAPEA